MLAQPGLERREEAAAARCARRPASRSATSRAPRRGPARRAPRSCCARRPAPRSPSTRSRARPLEAVEVELACSPGPSSRCAARRPGAPRRSTAGTAPRRSARPARRAGTRAAGDRRSSRCRRVGRRVDDPERRRRRVLRRSGRVGVERVALVEQRVDELVEPAHRASRRAVGDRRVEASAARARARRARSSVERLGLEPDEAARRDSGVSISSRHTASEQPVPRVAAPRHQRDLQPVVLAASRRSCPLKWKVSGTAPSSSASR